MERRPPTPPASTAPGVLDFAPFRLDRAAGLLYRGTDVVAVRPKAFAVLAYLAERPGTLVSREELLASVWADVTVTDDAPRFTVRELRRVLGDDPAAPRIIATVHGRGYRFIGGRAAEVSVDTSPATGCLVGRAGELATLDGWLATAASGERVVAFVAGDAGLGKTAVLEAFLARAAAVPSLRIARGDCRDTVGSGEPYQALLEALHALAAGADRDALVAALRLHAPTWLAQIPSLVDPTEAVELRQRTLGSTSGRMARELAAWVAAVAADRPLLLVIEDLHWSDGATLDALASIAHARGPARVLVLGTYRPIDVVIAEHPFRDFSIDLVRRRLARELQLPLLDRGAVQEYLTTRFGEVPPAIVQFVAERSDGNPLFMTALADHLTAPDGGPPRTWPLDARGAVGDIGIPDTLRGMIERQLDAVAPLARSLLEVGSVAGVEFATQSVVTALGELDPEIVEGACEDLARRTRILRFIEDRDWPDGSRGARFAFSHVLYRDVLYGRLPASRRARLHQLVGERLERGFAADSSAIAAELGRHFERSGDRVRAVSHLIGAAQVAQRRFADREAVAVFRHALELLAELPDGLERHWTEIPLRQAMGHSLAALHGERSPELSASAERLRVLADAVGESPGQVMALFSILTPELGEGLITAGRATAARILNLSTRVAPSFVQLGHLAVGITSCYAGDFDDARRHLEACPRDGTPGEWPVAVDPVLIVLSHLSELVLAPLGHPREVLEYVDATLAWAERLRHPYAQVMGWNAAANAHALLRNGGTALECAERGYELCARYDVPSFAHRVALVRAAMQAVQGTAIASTSALQSWLAVYERIGLVGKSVGLLAAVEVAAAGGRVDEALTYVDEGLHFVDATGERMREAELLRWRGELEQRRGTRAAREWFLRAADVAAAQRARWFELRALTRLVSLPRARPADRDRLARVVATFDAQAEWPDLRDAHALLHRA